MNIKRTPKQLEEWSFSTNNSEKNKIVEDETIVEEEEEAEYLLKELKEILEEEEEGDFTEKRYSNLEICTNINCLSTSCGSCCLSKDINESLKQHLEKLEVKNLFFCC